MERDERELVRRARNGDAEAKARIFREHREMVFRVAYWRTGDEEEALDICQETFLRAFRSLKGFRGESSLGTWLGRIANNLAIDALRKRKREKTVPMDESLEFPSTAETSARAQEQELREAIREALDKLPEQERTVVLLYSVEGRRYREIAQILSCPIGTVMSRLHNARKKLLQYLEPYL